MKGRAWRRHIEERVVIKRLRKQTLGPMYWYFVEDVNKNYYKKSIIVDYLEKREYFIAKTITTQTWDSKNKVKYSPNKNKPYYRDGKKRFFSRESDKIFLQKILKENGLK
jgi:hypothetical protein